MNFCSRCGYKNIEFRIPEGDNLPRYCCNNCGTIHYQNPNMVVGAIPIFRGKVLLAKRSIEPRKGFWNLPCGFLELNETVEEGAIREVSEETGAKIKLQRLHTVYNLPHSQQVYLIFLAEMQSEDFASKTAESAEVALFDLNDIPWQALAFSSNTFALKKYKEDVERQEHHRVHFGTF